MILYSNCEVYILCVFKSWLRMWSFQCPISVQRVWMTALMPVLFIYLSCSCCWWQTDLFLIISFINHIVLIENYLLWLCNRFIFLTVSSIWILFRGGFCNFNRNTLTVMSLLTSILLIICCAVMIMIEIIRSIFVYMHVL